MNLIGVKSACMSSESVAVDRSTPVMWKAATHCILASLFMKLTEPEALLPLVELWIGVNHMSAAYSILGITILW